jgi:hypothetical protein
MTGAQIADAFVTIFENGLRPRAQSAQPSALPVAGRTRTPRAKSAQPAAKRTATRR